MSLDELFIRPEVLHEHEAVDEAAGAWQRTRFCRSRLEEGCLLLEQETRWADGRHTRQCVYFCRETLAATLPSMREAVGQVWPE